MPFSVAARRSTTSQVAGTDPSRQTRLATSASCPGAVGAMPQGLGAQSPRILGPNTNAKNHDFSSFLENLLESLAKGWEETQPGYHPTCPLYGNKKKMETIAEGNVKMGSQNCSSTFVLRVQWEQGCVPLVIPLYPSRIVPITPSTVPCYA